MSSPGPSAPTGDWADSQQYPAEHPHMGQADCHPPTEGEEGEHCLEHTVQGEPQQQLSPKDWHLKVGCLRTTPSLFGQTPNGLPKGFEIAHSDNERDPPDFSRPTLASHRGGGAALAPCRQLPRVHSEDSHLGAF